MQEPGLVRVDELVNLLSGLFTEVLRRLLPERTEHGVDILPDGVSDNLEGYPHERSLRRVDFLRSEQNFRKFVALLTFNNLNDTKIRKIFKQVKAICRKIFNFFQTK
jgi:hypothetical protein